MFFKWVNYYGEGFQKVEPEKKLALENEKKRVKSEVKKQSEQKN